jgi:hypothetical protein
MQFNTTTTYTLDGISMRFVCMVGIVGKFQLIHPDGSDNIGTHPSYDSGTKGERLICNRLNSVKEKA